MCSSCIIFWIELFDFFSASTRRWVILKQKCTLQLQNLSKTRWSARHDACRVVNENRGGNLEILNEFANSTAERPSTRSVLKEKLGSIEITFMAVLWGDDDDDDFIK